MNFLKIVRGPLFASLGLILGLSACGDHSVTVGSSDDTSALHYSLDETINGDECTYTSPVYGNIADYCNALENGPLNRDPKTGEECGEDIRQSLFRTEGCPGTWTPTY